MKRFISFGSIEQFRNVVVDVTHAAHYVGQNENNEPVYDKTRKKPTLMFTLSEKIHGCFYKKTNITMADGSEKEISSLKSGMYVLTYNEKTHKNEINRIKNVLNQKLNKDWCKLIFDKTTIICTKDHKIYTKNRGYVEAQNLTVDDEFLSC